VAVLFGPEDRGLTNRELDPCHALIQIPTHPGLSSLNLAQAVLVLCYELYLANLYEMRNAECGMRNGKRVRREEAFSSSGLQPALAEFQKVEKMYAHLEQLLLRIGFLDTNNPKRIMHTLRRIFGRASLGDRDVAILREFSGNWNGTRLTTTRRRRIQESGARSQNNGAIFPVYPEVRDGARVSSTLECGDMSPLSEGATRRAGTGVDQPAGLGKAPS